MASPLAGLPPLDPNYLHHANKVFIGVGTAITFIATVCVILRFMARRLTQGVGWDDWFSLMSLLSSYGFFVAATMLCTSAHAGFHITQYSKPQLELFGQLALAIEILYHVSIAMSKFSVLALYRRIFAIKSFTRWIWVVSALVLAYVIPGVFGSMFAFHPIIAQWKLWLPSKHIDEKKFFLGMGITNLILDVIILAMPQVRVWKLQQTLKRKIMVSVVFLLGLIVCVTSIGRAVSLESLVMADMTFTLVYPGIWTVVEVNTSIICGCLPVLPNLLRFWFKGTLPEGRSSVSRSSRSRRGSSVSVSASKIHSIISRSRSAMSNKGGVGYSDIELGCQPLSTSSLQNWPPSEFKTKNQITYNMQEMDPAHIRKNVEFYTYSHEAPEGGDVIDSRSRRDSMRR